MKVYCCECTRRAKRWLPFLKQQDGTVLRVCLACWHRLGYDDHFSNKFKQFNAEMLRAGRR